MSNPIPIETRVERERGCGYRKPGGIYLVSEGLSAPCGRLPIELHVCPTCHAGVKPSRGWTWIDPQPFLDASTCLADHIQCAYCPLGDPQFKKLERVGLLWVGEKFYRTPGKFTAEAGRQGVSRRIPAVPNDFVIGETWVWLAHRKTVRVDGGEYRAGVFHAFRPDRIEYVVKGSESKEELERMIERGFTLVEVFREGEQLPMDFPAEEPVDAEVDELE